MSQPSVYKIHLLTPTGELVEVWKVSAGSTGDFEATNIANPEGKEAFIDELLNLLRRTDGDAFIQSDKRGPGI